MTEETVVNYFAEDGTPFEQDKDACIVYENFCKTFKEWLVKGTVMFWNHYSKYLNFDLLDYTFVDNTSYSDWLLKRLKTECEYLVINVHPCSDEWTDVWNFIKLSTNMGSECLLLEKTYCIGDLLNHNEADHKWHNASLFQRNVAKKQEELMNDVAAKGIDYQERINNE